MTLYTLTLFAFAAVSFLAVILPSIQLHGLTELGLALIGLGAFGGAIRTLEGAGPDIASVSLAALGSVIAAVGLVQPRI